MKTQERERMANITEVLGPKDKRYCSDGFRNVQFYFSDLNLFRKGLQSKVHVSFKAAWSSKESALREPHLGTTEYIAIAFLISETYLQCSLGFSSDCIARSWVKRVKLTMLPELERSSVQSVFLLDKTIGGAAEKQEGFFEIRIGHMLIELTVLYPADLHTLQYSCEDFNHPENRFYKDGYKTINHDILNVENDFPAMRSGGDIVLEYSARPYQGIGTHYFPAMDMATFILISGQLMQVLLYGLDNLTREKTNNLWLRRLEIDYPNPLQGNTWREEAECKSFREVRLKGEFWRVADVRLSLGNIQANFNVAHQINKEENENKNCHIGNAKIQSNIGGKRIVPAHEHSVHSRPNDIRMV